MAIDERQRQSVMLQAEANTIQMASNNTPEIGCALARALVDGHVNGMLRLEGAKPTAEYLFAVADRAAGKVLTSTSYAPRAPFDPGPLTLRRVPWWDRLTYSWGLVHGCWLTILVLIAMRRL